MAGIGADERHVIRTMVWSGFHGPDETDDMVADFLLDDPELDPDDLQGLIAAEFARKAAAEAAWPAMTDCDRLDIAFAGLAEERILALHDTGFTMSDGHADAAETLAQGPPGHFLGYCFYHRQDVERAVAGYDLWVAFDHVDGDGPDKDRVGRLVVKALAAAGLRPRWAGDPGQRIALDGFAWKRRFAG